jgi:hypothetical protein
MRKESKFKTKLKILVAQLYDINIEYKKRTREYEIFGEDKLSKKSTCPLKIVRMVTLHSIPKQSIQYRK